MSEDNPTPLMAAEWRGQANDGREELRLAAERVLVTHSMPQYSAKDHDEAIDDLAAALQIVRDYLARM